MSDDLEESAPPSSVPPSSAPSSTQSNTPICVNAVPSASDSAPAVSVNTSASRTRHDWYWIALCNAFGSDVAAEITAGSVWQVIDNPSATFSENQDIIQHVYDYYGALNNRNSKKCVWAGLARIAGGPFVRGFRRIDQVERQAKAYLDQCLRFPQGFWETLGHSEDCSGLAEAEEAQAWSECDVSIRALMRMGRDIFDDLAWQHEAYIQGGLVEIQRLAGAGEFAAHDGFSDATACVAAWTMIDQDDDGVWSGNLELFRREQLVTIPPGYRKLEGQFAVSTVMTYMAQSPHPWGRSFDDYFHQTPLGGRYVTNDRDRWDWMSNEVLPTWRRAGESKRQALIRKSLEDLVAGRTSVP
jgi:hypothetical protein